MRGMDRVDREQLFPLVEGSVPRGHKLKIRSGKFRGDLRKNIFTQRVVKIWNALPGRMVEAGGLTSVKSTWMRYSITFKVMGQVLACGIRWAGQDLS